MKKMIAICFIATILAGCAVPSSGENDLPKPEAISLDSNTLKTAPILRIDSTLKDLVIANYSATTLLNGVFAITNNSSMELEMGGASRSLEMYDGERWRVLPMSDEIAIADLGLLLSPNSEITLSGNLDFYPDLENFYAQGYRTFRIRVQFRKPDTTAVIHEVTADFEL